MLNTVSILYIVIVLSIVCGIFLTSRRVSSIVLLFKDRNSIDSTAKENLPYILFIGFSIFSLTYSSNPIRGIPGVVMYVFPLLYYSLSKRALTAKSCVWRLFKRISLSSFFYVLICFVSFFLPEYFSVFSYYGMGICVIPALMLLKSKKKVYALFFVFCLIPPLIFVKRTPLLGIAVAMMVFLSLIYKWKALIPSIVALIMSVALILSIPQFREKLFYGGEEMTVKDVRKSGNISENINMNGRTMFWAIVLDKYYEKSPYFGAGLGTVKSFLQSNKNDYREAFSLMHNDWLLVLCELGIVGVSLLLSFFIIVLRKCVKYSSRVYPIDLRFVSAACAGSAVSTMIHMFFENCTNSFIFSTFFVYYAILNYYITQYKRKRKLCRLRFSTSLLTST